MPNRHERTHGYELHRLHKPVRETLIDKWRETQCDHDWWEWTYEDATSMGARMGITVEKIQFSGFSDQGDGASFTGSYECMPDAVQKIKDECDDATLIAIAEELTLLQTTLKLQYGETFQCSISRDHAHYCHSHAMDLGDWGSEELAACEDLVFFAHEFRDLLRRFADWIYRQLEAEYTYLTSDEAVKESIVSSGLRFDADGEILR